jgi:hypothetical protein
LRLSWLQFAVVPITHCQLVEPINNKPNINTVFAVLNSWV